MKTVSISDSGWLASHPERTPGDLIRMVFSVASETGYDITVHGQHFAERKSRMGSTALPAIMPALMRRADRLSRLTRRHRRATISA